MHRSVLLLAMLLALLPACGGVTEEIVGGPVPTTSSTTTSSTTTSPATTSSTTTSSTTTSSTTTTTSTTTSSTTSTTSTTTTSTTVAPAPEPDPVVLGRGDGGPAVLELQQRLRDLRFWVPAEGDFDHLTEQAVYAFQKANGITVDGLVGPETREALADPAVPTPRSTQGRVTEVDKRRQLLYFVVDGALEWVFHTSTGTEEPYPHPDGHTALADTPPGTHSVFWQVDGWQDGVLGPLYRPKYFHADGIAVHGYDAVPPYPASHGCVRVTIAAMDHIWANGLMPSGSTVLVYGETPAPGPVV